MHELAPRVRRGRGPELILADCTALTRTDDARASAFERLEDAAGDDLARLLVGALAGRRREERLAA